MLDMPSPIDTIRSLIIGVCSTLFVLCLIGAVIISYTVFVPFQFAGQKRIVVGNESSLSSVANALQSDGVINNALFFRIIIKLRYPHGSIKAGTYTISSPISLEQATTLFVNGMPREEKTIRIIEGWNVRDIASYLDAQHIVSSNDFLTSSNGDYSDQFPFLPSPGAGTLLEGYLFPDTYRIYADSTPTAIIIKMLENFRLQYSAAMIRDTESQKKNIHDVVTLASILEKEVQSDTDRRMVADIFYRRIAVGMPLQADSTVSYAVGKRDTALTVDDLAVNSPYNTYVHKGLPPGPICNPGLTSLKAALYPLHNPYFYFLTTPDGRVVYSKTFEEHVKNKLTYLK